MIITLAGVFTKGRWQREDCFKRFEFIDFPHPMDIHSPPFMLLPKRAPIDYFAEVRPLLPRFREAFLNKDIEEFEILNLLKLISPSLVGSFLWVSLVRTSY